MVQLFGNSVLAETPGPGLASYQWPWSTSTDDLPPVDYQHDYSVQPLWVSSQTPAATTYFHPVSLFPPPLVFGMPPPQPLPPLPQQPPLLLPLGKPTTLGLVGTEPLVASGPPSLSAGSDGSRDFAQMTPVLKDSPPPPVELPVSKQLQKVWHGQFSKLFDQFQPDLWQLMPLGQNEPPAESQGWYFFKDSAKVRFECTACSHCWTSMKGRVCFWFSRYDVCDGAQLRREGVVIFKLFGQACNKCNGEQIYHAMWYPEEVEKVITNIYHRVGQVFYNFVAPPLLLARRRGRPRLQHNSERCEACKMGVCQQEWEFR